jgi:putative transposase
VTSPDVDNVFQLYRTVLTTGVLEYFQKQAGLQVRRGIYNAAVVLWLMILQRLQGVGTLAATVQWLIQGAADPLLQDCRRVRTRRISARTGAWSQARQKMPTLLCQQVSREIVERLRKLLGLQDEPGVYLMDGSSLELEHSRELVRKFPPASNQHGVSHWPVLKVLVLHELRSGLAEEPAWGPMFGPKAVSEQELAVQAMARLPKGSSLVGDRNFGVLWVAHETRQRGLGVLLRLTDVRARKLFGHPIADEQDQKLTWKATRWDGGKQHRLQPGTTVEGRLIAVRVGRGKSKKWFYFFTTLDWTVDKILEVYGLRWNIETDLRSLKRTVRLQHIGVKSEDMLKKELFMAMAAYNLTRSVMALAARKKGLDPRQLSFAHVLNVVHSGWSKLANVSNPQEFQSEFDKLLDLSAQCTLPQRKKQRRYERTRWRRQNPFPFKDSKEKTK